MSVSVLSVYDFTNYTCLERKIYKNSKKDFKVFKYIHAHNKKSGVRMIFIKENMFDVSKIIYCVNKNREAVIPITVGDGDCLKEEYNLEYIYGKDLNFFMDNLDEGDIVRTHEHAIFPGEMEDTRLKNILQKYLDG